MTLSASYRSLFVEDEAIRQLANLGGHVRLPVFNLATTSLRHLRKWYDRLQDISGGRLGTHPNFLSDPESIGLVTRARGASRLTEAGRLFLETASLSAYPPKAEYELLRILYFSGAVHRPAATAFLRTKHDNLLRFLRMCRPSASSVTVLESAKLLAIAESLGGFAGAVERFLALPRSTLLQFAALNEAGFQNLWVSEEPAGLARLTRKISGDFTRAPDRRHNFLISFLLLELRQSLIDRGELFGHLVIPEPYSNLINAEFLWKTHGTFTDDIRIVPEDGRFLIFRSADPIAAVTLPVEFGVRIPRPANRRSGAALAVRESSAPRPPIDQFLAKEAEDLIERKLKPTYGDSLRRIGHTNHEGTILSDGLVVGADFYVEGDLPLSGKLFIEVKSAISRFPASVRLTRAEIARAKWCTLNGIGYELYVVVFKQTTRIPTFYHDQTFGPSLSRLSIDDVVSCDVSIAN